MKKGMVTWRTNSAVHYLDDELKPICKAKRRYEQTWETFDETDVTCNKCLKIIKEEQTALVRER